ncbi:hypothetical protein DPMN_009413 [Dreissena polymorpha]|uniref:Uncharacterized protein n=1 Tax=Dreissena polymorpha TaxID=45954 RepID=A0A9D4S016_DREPO|nr:hypothetical protein DPMN_009413 [Dreissena polymorpha]
MVPEQIYNSSSPEQFAHVPMDRSNKSLDILFLSGVHKLFMTEDARSTQAVQVGISWLRSTGCFVAGTVAATTGSAMMSSAVGYR